MTALLLIGLLASLAFVWWTVFRVWPEVKMSQFRYRLWWIRDNVADEIFDGAYDSSDDAWKFVTEVEAVIQCARHLTIIRVWLLSRLGRAVHVPHVYEVLDFETLSTNDRRRLEMWRFHMERAVIWYALVGSVIGWIILAAIVSVTFPLELVRALRSRERTERDNPKFVWVDHGADGEENPWAFALNATKDVVHDGFEDAADIVVDWAVSGVSASRRSRFGRSDRHLAATA